MKIAKVLLAPLWGWGYAQLLLSILLAAGLLGSAMVYAPAPDRPSPTQRPATEQEAQQAEIRRNSPWTSK